MKNLDKNPFVLVSYHKILYVLIFKFNKMVKVFDQGFCEVMGRRWYLIQGKLCTYAGYWETGLGTWEIHSNCCLVHHYGL